VAGLVAGLMGTAGCSAAMANALLHGALVAAGEEEHSPETGRISSSGRSEAVLIFGGRGHDTFLGCLCDEGSSSSVFNPRSDYASRSADNSLFNRYGEFGSAYGDYSACYVYASDPPVLVLQDGTFVGRLTLNRNATNAIKHQPTLTWLKGVCAR